MILVKVNQGKQECEELIAEAIQVFASVSVKCKGWTMSGRKPGEQVSKDGISTGVGGFKWNPLEDSVQIKVPNLFFAKKT